MVFSFPAGLQKHQAGAVMKFLEKLAAMTARGLGRGNELEQTGSVMPGIHHHGLFCVDRHIQGQTLEFHIGPQIEALSPVHRTFFDQRNRPHIKIG